MNERGDDLLRIVATELSRPVPAGATALAERIVQQHGAAVRAVVFYGSCLRSGDDREGLLDLYVLVDGYRAFYERWALVVLNVLLPPNVFYLEVPAPAGTVRCKFAVISCETFAAAVSPRTFESYFWARFAQPCALVYAADEGARAAVAAAVATAVTTFAERAADLCGKRFTARELWTLGLAATYRAELRSERTGVAERLYAADPHRYAAVTRAALARLDGFVAGDGQTFERRGPTPGRVGVAAAWWLRRTQGKVLSLLRVLRNGLIFEGGIDYVLWKVARHSGVEVDTEWRQKRWRWLVLLRQFWRLYRSGAFR